MDIDVIEFNWQGFRESMSEYASLPYARRKQHIFRGQSAAALPLRPTLDRRRDWNGDDAARDRAIDQLRQEFRSEAIRLGFDPHLPEGDALDCLARHHGLPSPLLDWTRSPFVAAYFAFAAADPIEDASVAIWTIDLARMPQDFPLLEDLIDDDDVIRFNRRALQQRGVFLRVSSVVRPIEERLGDALRKIVLPANDAHAALAELDEMMVNATNLYYNLTGAAETATLRCEQQGDDHAE